jgi:hypothetical protein
MPVTERIPQLDALRGFLLVWMTLTHLPTRVSPYSNQAVGYVSAAEGFILLAAILVGRIHHHAVEKYGAPAAREKLLHRVFRIYGYHLALIGFAFSFCAMAAVYLDRVPLQNLLDFYLGHPVQALLAAPTLIYNPPLLDILPMYIVLMLATPVVLWCVRRWGWRPVLLASACVWLAAQFHLRDGVYAAAAHFGFPVPLREMGAFDLFGWQFLWTAGLALGSAREVVFRARIPRRVIVASGVIAAMFFVCRHSNFELLTGPVIFDALVNKWRLGIFRLIDAAAIGIPLVRFGSPLAATRLGLRLATLGRASLEVFSAQVVFCLVFLGLASGPDARFTPWQDAVVLAVTLTGLFMVAQYVAERAARRELGAKRQPAVRRKPALSY